MTTITPSWTEDITLVATQTLAAAASDIDDIDLAASLFDMVDVQCRGDFSATATDGCTISIFSSPDSGTNDDTISIFSQEVAVDAGNTYRISFLIRDKAYIAIKRKNDDSTYPIRNEAVKFAGRKWDNS